jgi:hypothetical protein
MKLKPAIVVVTYNRPESLKRLLGSLSKAIYTDKDIPLVISIDYQNSVEHDSVIQIAKSFVWSFGSKLIIIHDKNLGLKNHVLRCGDLVHDYESIIMLEDDIFVSPQFYNFTIQSISFYKNDNSIAGISLYTHKKNFLNGYPFETISDSNDVFFLQIASSWGQAWTKGQWVKFKDWLIKEESSIKLHNTPVDIINWPETSWLKYFIKYLVCTNRFFVYPKSSLTTNFGDSGSHNKTNNVNYQVPLFLGEEIRLVNITESMNVYDAYFEILPSKLKLLKPTLNKYDFSVDMYGLKELNKIQTSYLLSSKEHINNQKAIKSFGLEIKPMVLNIFYNIKGGYFLLDSTRNFKESKNLDIRFPNVFDYMFFRISVKSIFFLLVNRIMSKLKTYM